MDLDLYWRGSIGFRGGNGRVDGTICRGSDVDVGDEVSGGNRLDGDGLPDTRAGRVEDVGRLGALLSNWRVLAVTVGGIMNEKNELVRTILQV